MADYSAIPQRFFYGGVSLLPEDALPEGKISNALNVRSYQTGTLTTRWGSLRQSSNAMPASVHSLFRLNDTSLFATGGSPERRFAGAGTILYVGDDDLSAYNAVVTGQSGNPLTAISASPFNSPRPYLYVADSTKLRKINSSLNDYSIGLATPTLPPSGALAQVQTTVCESVPGADAWVSYGSAVPAAPAALPTITRINAIITHVVYDAGVTGMASVALDDMSGVVAGITLILDTESVIAQEVNPPVSPTTIGRILYDAGVSGLCTIQPTGSFTSGQVEAPIPDDLLRRYQDLNIPVPPQVAISRTLDFPVNSLVTLSGIETVQILSVAVGQDGTQSFRCLTAGTHVAGGAVDGVPSFRAYLNLTHVVGEAATAFAKENTITPANTTDPVVAGLQGPISGGERNWGLVGTQATQPDDIIRFAVRVSEFAYLQAVRLMLNVTDDTGTGGADFLHNYYFYEWRANDLLTAVQATQGAPTSSLASAQAGAVAQAQIAGQYANQYGYGDDPATHGVNGSDYYAGTPTLDPASAPTFQATGAGDGFVTAGSAPPRQLALGDDQWIVLQCRVSDLTRVGTEATKTLSNLNAVAITMQIQGTTDTITCDYTEAYLTGGYGPDVAVTLSPYVYRYRYRSTITGERSNPSPSMRAGLHPHRGRVDMTPGAVSGDAQCDTIDWFRYGGAMARWQYTGSQPNTLTPSHDDNSDSAIDGGEGLRTDLYQPWPSSDLPRTGTAVLAGTALRKVSGDDFNPNWGANSIIIVNGQATALYAQPQDSGFLQVIDNCGDGAAVTWSMPSPILLGKALPAMWGGPINDVWIHFACGDPADPSLIHWTHGNDPDATSDVNTLVVSSASEPLQNGFLFDGFSYVFSTDRLYRLTPTFGVVNPLTGVQNAGTGGFIAAETPCTKGLWSRWALAVAPEGVYFLAKDGIYLTAAGGSAISITDADLQPLFPQDGSSDGPIRGFKPIDFTAITRLKLTYVDSALYFDYQDINGGLHTWMYEPAEKRWTPDTYASGVTARLAEDGPQVHTNLYGCANGIVYQADADTLTDDGVAIAWKANTVWVGGDAPRLMKQWGDAAVGTTPGDGMSIIPVAENGSQAFGATAIGAGSTRVTTTVDIATGAGVLARNFGLQFSGSVTGAQGVRPLLYFWEVAAIPKGNVIAYRATDWEDLGYKGAKFIQGIVLRANTFNALKQIQVQYEGGHIGAAFKILHDGETTYAYPIAVGSGDWTPFVAELVRVVGVDAVPWMLLDWRWVWEPMPEASTVWETQEATFGLPGYMHARDAVIAYESECPVTLKVWTDTATVEYTLPASLGAFARRYVVLEALKGKWLKFRLESDSAFRLFESDTKIRVQGWGLPNGYLTATPFGGQTRTAAEV